MTTHTKIACLELLSFVLSLFARFESKQLELEFELDVVCAVLNVLPLKQSRAASSLITLDLTVWLPAAGSVVQSSVSRPPPYFPPFLDLQNCPQHPKKDLSKCDTV